MMRMDRITLLAELIVIVLQGPGVLPQWVDDGYGPTNGGLGQLMVGQWRCVLDDLVTGRSLARILAPAMQAVDTCYPDVSVHLYAGWPPRRKVLDPRHPAWPTWLRWGRRGWWDPWRRTVLLVHGFNGGHEKAPLAGLRDAYLERGAHNVLALDWSPLARYPCYADAVRHSRRAARCGAHVLAALGPSVASSATCVGHSLGAHICGMLSRALPARLYKVVALDSARPQVTRLLGSDTLSAADARVVQSFHTNMGFYGQYPEDSVRDSVRDSASFCVNGGRIQPQCGAGTRFVRMRCSHFLSVCYYAQLVRRQPGQPLEAVAVPCDDACNRLPGTVPLGLQLSALSAETGLDRWRGTHCLDMDLDRSCRIDA